MRWISVVLLFLSCAVLHAKPAKSKSPRPYVWVLDAGHGGHDVGTKGINCYEKDINLRVVKELETLLKKNKPGIKLVLTRTNDRYLSLDQRCRIANNAGADLFVSVHVNYAPHNFLLQGTETFYANPRSVRSAVQKGTLSRSLDRSELLAWLMQRNYGLGGRISNRGAKRSNYYVCLHTTMPAVLTEVGFMSNLAEQQYMLSDAGVRQLAACIYNALAEYHAVLQAGTITKTLNRLRTTSGRESGVTNAVRIPIPAAPSGTLTTPKAPLMAANTPQEAVSQAPQESEIDPFADPIIESSADAAIDPLLNGMADGAQTANAQPQEGRIASPDEPNAAVVPAAIAAPPAVNSAAAQIPDSTSTPPSLQLPIFSIQLFAVSNELKSNDPRLKGFFPVTFVRAGNMFKALYGGTTSYPQAQQTLAVVRKSIPDAFIVAYLGDKPITTADALKMTAK